MRNLKICHKLEERNKIAQEIHDNIGHVLSGALMQLEAAKLLIGVDVPKSKSIIQSSINVLREGMNNIIGRGRLRFNAHYDKTQTGEVTLINDKVYLEAFL